MARLAALLLGALPLARGRPVSHHQQSRSLLAEDVGEDPNFLPTVKCVQVLALANSSSLPGLKEQLKAMKLEGRAQYLVQQPDPAGKASGCFSGHVQIWNEALARGCEEALVLEEDARFEGPVLKQAMASVDAFLNSGTAYDMYFLGWNADFFTGGHLPKKNLTKLSEVPGAECSYKVQFWFETHAYIISKAAMQRMRNLTYTGTPIDNYLSIDLDVDSYVVRPKVAFQTLHTSQAAKQGDDGVVTDGPDQLISETPAIWYSVVEPQIWAASKITTPPSCLAPTDAYTTVPELTPTASPEPLAAVLQQVIAGELHPPPKKPSSGASEA